MSRPDDQPPINPYASPQSDLQEAEPEPDALLRIRRAPRLQDWGRGFRVVVNGRRIGYVHNGRTKEFAVFSGGLEIAVKMDWCGSPAVRCELAPGETGELECSSAFYWYNGILAPFYALFAWRKYLTLRLVRVVRDSDS